MHQEVHYKDKYHLLQHSASKKVKACSSFMRSKSKHAEIANRKMRYFMISHKAL